MVLLGIRMDENPLVVATTPVDEFGITPLHFLSLSQTLNLKMLLAVVNGGYLDHIIRFRDSFGSTPMDYLSLNQMPNSNETRFEQLVGGGLDQVSCLAWTGHGNQICCNMLQEVDKALAPDWPSRKRDIVSVYLKLANYERQGIISLLTLRLWKTKIDGASANKETVDREFCRIKSGTSIVLPQPPYYLFGILKRVAVGRTESVLAVFHLEASGKRSPGTLSASLSSLRQSISNNAINSLGWSGKCRFYKNFGLRFRSRSELSFVLDGCHYGSTTTKSYLDAIKDYIKQDATAEKIILRVAIGIENNSDTYGVKKEGCNQRFLCRSGSSEIHEHYRILSGLQTPTVEDAVHK
eukprot:scaffold1190_cov69-Cylindrotheca_fusiformis.AAC.5